MVGLVLVSHSRPLALAVQDMVRSMTGPALPLAIAAGAGDNQAELGTDAVAIADAIRAVQGPDGVLVLMDMGSAILSSETALDLMERDDRRNVRFCSAPFVEGAVAAGVTANLGAKLAEVHAEALRALKQKEQALHPGIPVEVTPPAIASLSDPHALTRLTIRNPHGLHSRPAARMIAALKPYQAEVTIRNLSNGRGPMPARSLSRVASLEILEGHEIEVSASGSGAADAVEAIAELARTYFGEAAGPAPAAAAPATSIPGGSTPLPISEGLAIGASVYFRAAEMEIPRQTITDVPAEIDRLQKAVAAAQAALKQHRKEMAARVGAENAGIYDAQIIALQDLELIGAARQLIAEEHKNAAMAWTEAGAQVFDRYSGLQDPYLRERAADVRGVTRQVLGNLVAKPVAGPILARPSILIADELTPQQISSLPKDFILGVILLDGGATAHSSILLRALEIPAVVQARAAFPTAELADPGLLAFDGATGEIWRDPGNDLLAQLQERQAEQRKRACQEKKTGSQPAETLDGHRVAIFANIGHAAEVAGAIQTGAEGVGLLRTEFLFLDRETAPTEDDQFTALEKIAAQLGDHPLVVRTLDIGGDKPAPFLAMLPEENPFLGVRALRLCFAREEIFLTHLRAILRAARNGDFKIMFPMVADVSDLDRARAVLARAHEALTRENVPHAWPVPTGVMIEIPSAALQTGALAERADFFSIGTNDLTQYTLAADRGNPALAAYQDALHPAVLNLVDQVVRGARQHGRSVAVCGEAASDALASLLFVGLGVDELSVTPGQIPRLKASLRGHKLAALRRLAQSALECKSAAEVRELSLP